MPVRLPLHGVRRDGQAETRRLLCLLLLRGRALSAEGGGGVSYTRILYPQLRDLLDRDAQLVEVLPATEYEELRLPDARSIPLKTIDARTTAELDRAGAVIVYCWDALCDLSPRAACRLDTLGFEHVYDDMPSKVDWMARGLPLDGTKASEPRTIDYARHDVITCRLTEPIRQVAPRIADSPYGFALVPSTLDGCQRALLRRSDRQRGQDRSSSDGALIVSRSRVRGARRAGGDPGR